MSKETAVEWLFQQIYGDTGHIGSYTTDGKDAFEAFEQAKEQEREQILNAYREGRTDQQAGRDEYFNRTSVQYYNETYKGGEQ